MRAYVLVTYGICACEFLFGVDGCPRALGSVQGRLALYDGLSLGGAVTSLAADLGDSVPVIHIEEGVEAKAISSS